MFDYSTIPGLNIPDADPNDPKVIEINNYINGLMESLNLDGSDVREVFNPTQSRSNVVGAAHNAG